MTSWLQLPKTFSYNPLLGSLLDYVSKPPGEQTAIWEQDLGHTYRIQGPAYSYFVYTTSPIALRYILSHPTELEKSPQTRKGLGRTLGKGVLVAEGEDHRRMRRVLAPAFAPSVVKSDYLPVFFDKSQELVGVIRGRFALNNPHPSESIMQTDPPSPSTLQPTSSSFSDNQSPLAGMQIDLYSLLSHATLDIIGSAGLGCEFGCLQRNLETEGEEGCRETEAEKEGETQRRQGRELADAYSLLFPAEEHLSLMSMAKRYFWGDTRNSVGIVNRIGTDIIEAKKKMYKDGGTIHEAGKRLNLLQLIVNANLDPTLPPTQSLTDEEVLGNLTTLLFAGHDTSSSALSWTLLELSRNQELQRRLREECRAVEEDTPGLDTLDSLPLLDAVLKETLRFHPPVTSTSRWTTEEVAIPLGDEPIEGERGIITEVKIPRGVNVLVPILNVNTNEKIWGPDAKEFKPSRWMQQDADGGKTKPYSGPVPGIFSNLMTFNGGPSACIGVRFATTEMKVVLFTLMRNFIFEAVEPNLTIKPKEVIVVRPTVDGKVQLPLMVRLVD